MIKFEEEDPFNPGNILKGYINRRQGQLYGSLWITHVNGKPLPQFIYSAPKQHYPFDKNDNWEFPEGDSVEVYEKLDGTCIISYVYEDEKGDKYLTFKTRLRPFLGKSKFGNFFSLWKEMLDKYGEINLLTFNSNYNFVFELYGKRNKILIDYDVPLDTRLLFSIDRLTGDIIPPSRIKAKGCPKLYPLKIINLNDYDLNDKINLYKKLKSELDRQIRVDEENQILKGKEGYVLYFIRDNKVTQIKNKPNAVLKYHWSPDAIPYESIYTTVVNAFENFDTPTYEDVVSLLKEEFDDSHIEKSSVRINKILEKVLFEKKFQSEIEEEYRKLGISIKEDTRSVMRWFAQKYPKSMASKIYNVLIKLER